jgi:hypothetical protein
MTVQEYKTALKNAADPEWWSSKTTSFAFPHIDFSQDFAGILEVYRFVSQQSKAWDSLDPKNAQLRDSLDYFYQLKDGFEKLLDVIDGNRNQLNNAYNQNIQQVFSRFQTKYIFLAESPQVKFLTDQQIQANANLFAGAFTFFTNQFDFRGQVSQDKMKGLLMAYEFIVPQDYAIPSRSKKERLSLNQLRISYSEEVKKIEDYFDKKEEEVEKRLKDGLDDISNRQAQLDQDQKDFIEAAIDREKSFQTEAKQKLETLLKTYAETLKFKEPGEYWERRASKMQKQAWWAFFAVLLLTAGTGISLYQLLTDLPQDLLNSFFGDDKSTAIRWSILFIAFLSFIAFGIRALTKVMFSSFHLSRDAQERFTLTYFYLALINDSKIEPDDRKLIIQSLFSRSDTGLLKEDSGPTMPAESIIAKAK